MAVLLGAHLEGHALLDGVVARDDPLDGGVEVLALGLGEEPDVAEVDPEQRHARTRGRARHRAGSCRRRRARRPARSRSTPRRRGRRRTPRRRPRRPAGCPRGRRAGRRPRRRPRAAGWRPRRRGAGRPAATGCVTRRMRRDGCRHRRPPLAGCVVVSRTSVADPVLAHCVRRHRPRPQEVLGVAARAADRAGPDAVHVQPVLPHRGHHLLERPGAVPGSVTTPCPLRRPRPTSNCGFTSSDEVGLRTQQAGEVAHDEGERDERQVGDDEVGRPAEVLGGQAAHGRAAALVDPRVAGQLGHQLPVADVDRDDSGQRRGPAAPG